MKNIRLLFVDDNHELINMMKEYFSSRAGIEVVKEAYDGEEALDYIKENPDAFPWSSAARCVAGGGPARRLSPL